MRFTKVQSRWMKWFESQEHITIHCAKSYEIAIKKKLNRNFM